MMTNMKCKPPIVELNLRKCDYSDAYILVSGSISVADTSAAGAVANDIN